MPGPESGPGGPQGKPFREREKEKNTFNLDDLLNPKRQKGGEMVPTSGSAPASGPEASTPAASTPNMSPATPNTSPAVAGASMETSSGGGIGSHAGNVAVLERPMAQTETSTGNVIPGTPPPEIGIEIPEPETGDPLRIVLTSLDQNVDAFAREAAQEKLAKKHEGPLWKRIAKSAWHNITREYQLVKATREARQEIIENDNLLHHQGKSDQRWRESTVDRYGSEYGEQLIHEGETFNKLNAPEAATDPKAERIRNDVQDVMRQVARGEVADDDSLQLLIDRMTEQWKDEGISQDYIGEGNFLAHNIGRKARELEAMINSAEGLSAVDKEALLEAHLSKMEIVAGEARVGSRVEVDSTISERIAEKLRGVPFLNEGRIARVTAALGNETVIAAMMSGAIYAAKRGASLAGKIVAPGIGAGVVAAIREANALQDERALEERRSDAGKAAAEVPDDSELGGMRKLLKKVGVGKSAEEYRAELNATQYEARPVGELLDDLSGLYNEAGGLNILDRESFDQAVALMGQIRARIQISDRTGARLISFADVSPEEMESRRFDLDLAMAKLETDMKKFMEDPTAQIVAGITPEEQFDQLFTDQRDIAEGMIMGEMRSKDRLFRKLVAKRAFKRALAATFMGGAIGGAVKYGSEAAREVYHSVREAFTGLFNEQAIANMELAGYETNGVPDHAGSTLPDHAGSAATPDHAGTTGPNHAGGAATPDHAGTQTPDHAGTQATDHAGGQTPDHAGTQAATPDHAGTTAGSPDHAGSGIPDHAGTSPEGVDAGGESTQLSDTSKLNLPSGYNAEAHNGTLTITGPDGKEYSDLKLNPDGSLSDSAQETLKANGFTITDNQELVQGKPEFTQSDVNATQFVENHKEDMKLIHHTKWFDNNTSKFDLNELGLDNHMDSNGNIVVDIRGMTEGGSFHGASGVDWHEAAKQGHLKVFLSASKGTQAHAFEISIRPDGTAIIDKDSPAGSLFDSHGTFIGGYQEVALVGDKAPDGGENIATLATVVGKHHTIFRDRVPKPPTFHSAHTYTITPPVENTAFTSTPTAPTGPYPFVPFTTRRRVGEAEDLPTPEPPAPAPLELAAAPAPLAPAGELGAAPESPRSAEAEELAASRGLGSSPTAEQQGAPQAPEADTGDTDTGPDTTTPDNDNEQQPDDGFTDQERAWVRQIDSDSRSLPREFNRNMLDGLSPRERKLAIILVHEAMNEQPRGAGENKFGYARRITRVLKDGASVGRSTRLPLMSPALQAVASKVFDALEKATMA